MNPTTSPDRDPVSEAVGRDQIAAYDELAARPGPELRVVMEELLARSRWIEPHPEHSPERAKYPASGFTVLPLRIR